MAWGAALLLAGAVIACDPAQPRSAEAVAAVDGAGEAGGAKAGAATATGERAGDASASATATGERAGDASAAKDAGNPLGGLVPPSPGQERLVGVVAEHLPAGGYTYLWVEPEEGPARWVVTMRRDVGQGDRISVDSLGSRHDFYSRRLDRRFAELTFGVVEIVG